MMLMKTADMKPRQVKDDMLKHLDAVTKTFMKREGLVIEITVEDNTLKNGKGNWMVSDVLTAGTGWLKHPVAHVTTLVFQHVTAYPLKTRKMPLFVDAYVNLVYTNEEYRGRGYAGILLRLFTRWFDEHGMVANLDVASLGNVSEEHLIKFYKHEGFELVEKNNDITGGAIMVRKPIKRSGKVSSTRVSTPKAELGKLLALASRAGL